MSFQDVKKRSTNVVESWDGSKTKQSYTYIMTENSSFAFTWAFQRTSQASDVSTNAYTRSDSKMSLIYRMTIVIMVVVTVHQVRRYANDIVKIYSVSVTNAVDGVASACRACALKSKQAGSSCVPCPAGHYIDKKTNQCQKCPPNTILSGQNVYGKEACQPCGPGSKSNKVFQFFILLFNFFFF